MAHTERFHQGRIIYRMNIDPMLVSYSQLYERFIDQIIGLSQKKDFSLTALISNYISMNYQLKLEQIDKLKAWLDDFRPFDQTIIAELKKLYDVRFTYNSNAIEGNTLTQSETELVLTKGITIGGKTLDEHLEVIGHKEAIDYIESLAQKDTVINELFDLVCDATISSLVETLRLLVTASSSREKGQVFYQEITDEDLQARLLIVSAGH